jgi:hypothetical protein
MKSESNPEETGMEIIDVEWNLVESNIEVKTHHIFNIVGLIILMLYLYSEIISGLIYYMFF